jgi:hypothetical protein
MQLIFQFLPTFAASATWLVTSFSSAFSNRELPWGTHDVIRLLAANRSCHSALETFWKGWEFVYGIEQKCLPLGSEAFEPSWAPASIRHQTARFDWTLVAENLDCIRRSEGCNLWKRWA